MAKSTIRIVPPLGICWNITSRCNYSCRFCFRNIHSQDLPVSYNLDILNKLNNIGIRKISWTGGEPTLYEGLYLLAEKAKHLKIITSITTNASLASIEFLKKYQSLFDWITLPLDASVNSVQHKLGRNDDHNNRVLWLLNYLSKYSKGKMKVNSVLTKENQGYIIGIFEIINKFDVKRWKIFRFLPSRGYAKINRHQLELSDQEFNTLSLLIHKESKKHPNIEITIVDKKDFEDSHFTIEPNGDIQKYVNGSYKDNLNICTDQISEIIQNNKRNNCSVNKRYKKLLSLSELICPTMRETV